MRRERRESSSVTACAVPPSPKGKALQRFFHINLPGLHAALFVEGHGAVVAAPDKGLVRIVPHVGCFVSSITQEEFHEVFELRGIIECYAASWAATHMPEEEIRQWLQSVDKCEQALSRGDLEEFNQMEIVLHDYLIDSLKNKRIQTVMESVADSIYRERKIAMGSMENVEESVREHRAIAMAIAKRDPVEAEQAMKTHIRNVEYRIERVAFGK